MAFAGGIRNLAVYVLVRVVLERGLNCSPWLRHLYLVAIEIKVTFGGVLNVVYSSMS